MPALCIKMSCINVVDLYGFVNGKKIYGINNYSRNMIV